MVFKVLKAAEMLKRHVLSVTKIAEVMLTQQKQYLVKIDLKEVEWNEMIKKMLEVVEISVKDVCED